MNEDAARSEPDAESEWPVTPDERIDELESRVDAALDISQRAIKIATEAQDEHAESRTELEGELDAIRSDIDQLRDRTDLIKHVADASALDIDQRAAICLQTTYNDALENEGDRAFLTAHDAWTTLGRSIDRTRMYDTLRRAAALVGDEDVCWFKTEPRGNDPPSRLIVDVSEKRLPSQVAGVQMEVCDR